MKILHLSDLHIGAEGNLVEVANSDGSPRTRRCEVIFDNIIANCKPTSDYTIRHNGRCDRRWIGSFLTGYPTPVRGSSETHWSFKEQRFYCLARAGKP